MEKRLLRFCQAAGILLFLISIGFPESVRCQPSETAGLENLRRAFIEAVGNDLELVRDELEGDAKTPRTPGRHWLAHVKPKRSGHYSLKYTYNYQDKFFEAGESTLNFSVGGKICHRYPLPGYGLSGVCLGDTVIIPIRLHFFSDHAFSLKYTPQEPQTIKQAQESGRLYLGAVNAGRLADNPLEKHLKYLGTRRSERPHRNGGSTVVYSAVFEALSPGRFNLILTSNSGGAGANYAVVSPAGSTPVIIVDPGTPVTALVWKEDTITYADKGRFSSHGGNNFLTDLLILQPGDVFVLDFSTAFRRGYAAGKDAGVLSEPLTSVLPVVHKFPFSLDKDRGFNDFIAGHLPPAGGGN